MVQTIKQDYADYVLALSDTVVHSSTQWGLYLRGHRPRTKKVLAHLEATPTLRSPYFSYAHIILLKIRLRLLYNHTHLLTYEQAPSERECYYMIDGIYLFQQNMLACLRMCIFCCTFADFSTN